MRLRDVIRRPLITEKSSQQRETAGVIAFEVDPRANKIEVKKAVEAQFSVRVSEVRVTHVQGKVRRQGKFAGRRPSWKKAYVRLAEGEKAPEFFEGV